MAMRHPLDRGRPCSMDAATGRSRATMSKADRAGAVRRVGPGTARGACSRPATRGTAGFDLAAVDLAAPGTRLTAPLFDERLESLQVPLDTLRHDPEEVADLLDE